MVNICPEVTGQVEEWMGFDDDNALRSAVVSGTSDKSVVLKEWILVVKPLDSLEGNKAEPDENAGPPLGVVEKVWIETVELDKLEMVA